MTLYYLVEQAQGYLINIVNLSEIMYPPSPAKREKHPIINSGRGKLAWCPNVFVRDCSLARRL